MKHRVELTPIELLDLERLCERLRRNAPGAWGLSEYERESHRFYETVAGIVQRARKQRERDLQKI